LQPAAATLANSQAAVWWWCIKPLLHTSLIALLPSSHSPAPHPPCCCSLPAGNDFSTLYTSLIRNSRIDLTLLLLLLLLLLL
jgi:hypothetical protein